MSEKTASLIHAIEELGKREVACRFCMRCRLAYFMAHAAQRRDPYALCATYRLLQAHGADRGSIAMLPHVEEALAWLSEPSADGGTRPRPAADAIRRWREGEILSPVEVSAALKDSRLVWPLLIVKAAMLEKEGGPETAIGAYETAYRAIPPGMGEKRSMFVKLNAMYKERAETE